ncbi:MAG: peptidylprolyl isomerase [Salibacteraceae bacterium]
MLKKKIKLNYSNLKKYLLVSAILCASIIGKAQNEERKTVDKVVAVVADQIVLQSELETAAIQYARSGQVVEENSRCVIFEDLLFKKLLLNQAAVDSLEISEDQISGEIDRRIQYFVQQIGSEKKLEEFYGKSIPAIRDEFHDLIQEQMLIQQMQGSITADVDISPKEVKVFFNKIPEDSLPFVNSEVVVEHIVIDPVISEEEKKRTQEKLEGFRQRILQGEDFGTLAFLYSQDPGSARKNGELGFMKRGALVKEFAAVAFSIQPGQVSEVFETEYGFHIVQLIERRGQQANVRHILLKPSISTSDLAYSKTVLDSLKTQILNVDSVKFEGMAAKYSDDKSTRMNGGKMINPETGSTTFEIDQVSKVDPSLFFILDKMKPGEISDPVIYQKFDGSQSYRLVKLVSVTDAHRANLEDDYLKIQGAAKAEKEKEAVDKWIQGKIKINYIKIDDQFQDCEFQHSWF